MDHDSREALGRIARWVLLGAAGAWAVVVVVRLALGLPGSLAVSTGWLAPTDAMAHEGEDASAFVFYSPPTALSQNPFYTARAGEPFRTVWDSSPGVNYLQLPAASQPGPPAAGPAKATYLCLPNPYGGYGPIAAGTLFVYPRGTRVLLVDSRSLLHLQPDGRLVPQAAPDFAPTSGKVPLAELAQAFPVACLLTTPMRDYGRARAVLQRLADWPVVPGSTNLNRPAEVREMLALVGLYARELGVPPLVATEDAELAHALWLAGLPACLVGAGAAPNVASGPRAPQPRPPAGQIMVFCWADVADAARAWRAGR